MVINQLWGMLATSVLFFPPALFLPPLIVTPRCVLCSFAPNTSLDLATNHLRLGWNARFRVCKSIKTHPIFFSFYFLQFFAERSSHNRRMADKHAEPEEGYRVPGCIIYNQPPTEHLLMSFTCDDLLKARNRAKSEPRNGALGASFPRC